MQIVVDKEPEHGVPLQDVPFGTVVKGRLNDVYYIVASPMDCTGRKVLVTLEGGTLKEPSGPMRVIPVKAVLIVNGAL